MVETESVVTLRPASGKDVLRPLTWSEWAKAMRVASYLSLVYVRLRLTGRVRPQYRLFTVWGIGAVRWALGRDSGRLRSFQHMKGHAYYAPVFTRSHCDRVGDLSTLTLFEDGRPLGPARTMHVDIHEKGAGRYSHWWLGVLFSASDNSDPRTNGRVYTFDCRARS